MTMPRNIRNFWIECHIDGRTEPLTGGPVSKEGGFHMTIRQRDQEMISPHFLSLRGIAHESGGLDLQVRHPNGQINVITVR